MQVSRGGWTPIELCMAGVQGLEATIRATMYQVLTAGVAVVNITERF